MSSRLPVVSGEQLVRALERAGWQPVRQRGSHVRLKHPDRLNALTRAAASRGQAWHAGRDPHRCGPLRRGSAAAALTISRQAVRSSSLCSLLEQPRELVGEKAVANPGKRTGVRLEYDSVRDPPEVPGRPRALRSATKQAARHQLLPRTPWRGRGGRFTAEPQTRSSPRLRLVAELAEIVWEWQSRRSRDGRPC